MIPEEKKILLQAWEENQKAEFQILQALSDIDDLNFDQSESIKKAITNQTNSSHLLTKAKTLIQNPSK